MTAKSKTEKTRQSMLRKKHTVGRIPAGYESMDLEWDVDPYQSTSSLAFQEPAGWSFFELHRKDAKATVTYIRPVNR